MSNPRKRKQSKPPPWKRFTKMATPWLPLGSEHEVIVTCTTEGPFKFSLITKEDEERLQQLTERLHSTNLKSFKSSSYIGQWCVAPSGREFRRVSVVSTNNDVFTLFSLDYGYKFDLSFSALYELPEFARSFAPVARTFSLNGIEEFKTSQEMIRYFAELIEGKKLTMTVGPSLNGQMQSCDLTLDNRINVLDQIRNRFASYPDNGLNANAHYRVLVTKVKNEQIPWTFIIHLNAHHNSFQELKHELALYCNNLVANEHFDPSIGSPVFAITEDACHRALVVAKNSAGIEVRYVDYCVNCIHTPSQLRPALTSLVTKLPVQGLECQLQSVSDSMEAGQLFIEHAYERAWNMKVVSLLKTNVFLVRLFDDTVHPFHDINMDLCVRSLNYQHYIQPSQFAASVGVPPGFRPRMQLPQSAPSSILGAPALLQSGYMHLTPSPAQDNSGGVPGYGHPVDIKLYRPLAEQLAQQTIPQLARPLEALQRPQQEDAALPPSQWVSRALENTDSTPNMTSQLGSHQHMSLDTPLLPAHQPHASDGPQAKQLTAEKPLVDDSETTPKSLQKDRDRRQRRRVDRENDSKNDECWGVAKKFMLEQKSPRGDDRSNKGTGRDRRDGNRSNDGVGRDRRDGNHSNEGIGRDRRDGNRSNEGMDRDRRDGNRSNEGMGNDHQDGNRSNKNMGRDRRDGNRSNEGMGRDRRDGNRSNEGMGRDRRAANRTNEGLDKNLSNGQSCDRDRRDSDRSQNRDRRRSRDDSWGHGGESGKKTTRGDDLRQNGGGANGRRASQDDSWGQEHNRGEGRGRNKGRRDRTNNNDVHMASNKQPEESWDPVEIPSQGSGTAGRSESSAAQVPPRVLETDDWVEVPKLRIPSNELTIGHTLSAVMVYMFTPHDFYMQPVCPALDALMEKVESLCAGQASSNVSADKLGMGDACLAQFQEDGVWYRAEFVSMSNGKAKVKFVDYGNITDVDESALRQATEELTSLPSQAIYCKLKGSKPSQGESWSAEELERFQEMLDDQTVQVQLVALEGLQLSQFSVVIKKGDTCVNEQFGASPESLLPYKSLPASRPLTGDRVFISWFLTPDNFHVKFESLVNELRVLQREIQEMACPAKLEALEEKSLVLALKDEQFHRAQVLGIRGTKVRISFLDQGFIQVVDISKLRPCPESLCRVQRFSIPCRLEGVEPVPGPTWPIGNELINEVFQSSPSFGLVLVREVDEQWSIELINNQRQSLAELLVAKGLAKSTNEVAAVEEQSLEPRRRCPVVVNSCQDLGWFYVMRLADQAKLDSIQDVLNVREKLDTLKPTLDIPEHLVAAKSPDDDQWYRGLIMSEATEQEGVSVQYVDYGNFGVVPYVVELPEDVVSVPPLATKCCLPVSSPTSPEAIAQFTDIVNQESVTLSAHVLCKLPDDCLCVDLSVSGTSILELLGTSSLLTDGYISATTSSPQEFYVQLKKHEGQIQELEERLVQGGEWEVLTNVEKGMMCLAQFSEDQAWYRARITLVTDSKVKVMFVDYGNFEEVTQFRKLPQDLLDMPPFALACSVEIEEELEVQSFLELARDGTVLYQIILPENQTQSPLPVSLIKNGEDVVDLVKPVQAATVKMSHFDSLGDFYVQFVSDDELISTMSEKLQRNETLSSVQEGDMVGAKFEDGTWYRAKVITDCKVKFIDFGTEFETNELKLMDEDLSSIPPLAYHCKFTKTKRLTDSDKTRVEQALIDYLPFEATIHKFLVSKQQLLTIPNDWIVDSKFYNDDESASSQMSIHTRSKATSENESSTYYSTGSDTDSDDESTDVGNEHVVNDDSSECDENDPALQTVLEEQFTKKSSSSTETIDATDEMDLVSNPEKLESTSYNEDMDLVSDDVFESTTQTLSLADRLRINSADLMAPPVTPETRKESEMSSSLDEEALLKALDSITRESGVYSPDSDELETAEIVESIVEKSIEETSDIDLAQEKVGSTEVTFTINVVMHEDREIRLTSPRTSEFGQAMIETIRHDIEELDELIAEVESEEREQAESELPVEEKESELPTEEMESELPAKETETELPTGETESELPTEETESELPTEETESELKMANTETEQTESELEFKTPNTSLELQVVTEFGESKVAFVAPEQISPIEGSEVHSLDSYAFNDKNDSDVEESIKESGPDIEEDRDAIVLEYNAACAGNEVLEITSEAAGTGADQSNEVLDMESETQDSSADLDNNVLEIPSETQGSSTDLGNKVLDMASETQGSSADLGNKLLDKPSKAGQSTEVLTKETSSEGIKVVEMKEKAATNEKPAAALSLGGYGQLMMDQRRLTPTLDEILYEEQLWSETEAMLRAEEERRDRRLQQEAEKLFTKFLKTATAFPGWFDSVKPQWSDILAKTQRVDPDEWHSIRSEIEALLATLAKYSVEAQCEAMEMATLVPLPADDEDDYDQVDSVPESMELKKESMQHLELPQKESIQALESPKMKESMHLTKKESTELLESPKKESMQALELPKIESIELESPKKMLTKTSIELHDKPVHLSPSSGKCTKLSKKRSMEYLDMTENSTPPKEKFMKRLQLSKKELMEMPANLSLPLQQSMEVLEMPANLSLPLQQSMEVLEMPANLSLPLQQSMEVLEMPANLSLPLQQSMEVLEMPANLSLPTELSVHDEIRGSSIMKPEPNVPLSCETTPKQVRSKVRDLVKAWEEQSPTKKNGKPSASPNHK